MAAQHKRHGSKAKKERRRRLLSKPKSKTGMVVHYPKRWDPECFCDISPGRCVAWADGRHFQTLEGVL